MHAVEDSRVESRSRPRDLVGEIDCVPLAHEIFLPAHAAIRRRLVRLAAEVGAVDHYHRHPARRRHLVLHVHLVDRNMPTAARPSESEKTMSPPTMKLPWDCTRGVAGFFIS